MHPHDQHPQANKAKNTALSNEKAKKRSETTGTKNRKSADTLLATRQKAVEAKEKDLAKYAATAKKQAERAEKLSVQATAAAETAKAAEEAAEAAKAPPSETALVSGFLWLLLMHGWSDRRPSSDTSRLLPPL